MDFLRFTTKQNWRKVVEEPNSEEKTRLFWWCYYGDAERKRLDFRRCLPFCHCISLLFTMDPVLAGYGCWRGMPSLKMIWFVLNSPATILREFSIAQTKKEEVSKTFKRPKQKGARCRNTKPLEVMKENATRCSVPWIEKPLNGCFPAEPSILFSML